MLDVTMKAATFESYLKNKWRCQNNSDYLLD